jgi:UDP-N-acetylglucosamine 2-epimerase (hydrolysing)
MLQISPKQNKSILFVTGTRADYGKLEPLALEAANAGFSVTFFVTGMHMMEKYGLTKNEIHRADRFNIVEYVNQRDGDPQDMVAAKTIVGFSDFLQEMQPDLVIVHGDRVEALACALVCAMNYILCAHIEGGEVSGTIDEVFRHCNTKLSSIHLVSSEVARQRVLRLGEAETSVEVIGSPELDVHAKASGVDLEEVLNWYEIPSDDYGICIFHPVTSEVDSMAEQAASIFSALRTSGKFFVVIMPNNDPGSAAILDEIETLPDDQFRVLPSMRFHYFSELLKNANVLIGNSSAGVREAPYLGVPSLSLGTRQTNRALSDSVTETCALNGDKIESFIADNWGKRFEADQSFGDGSSAQRFRSLLLKASFWERPMQKYFAEEKACA